MDDIEHQIVQLAASAEELANETSSEVTKGLLLQAKSLLLRAGGEHHTDRSDTERTLASQLRALGQRGILIVAAEQGLITELRCAMPNCVCPDGASYFEPKPPPPSDWSPTVDHFPVLKKDGGQLVLENVRLAHRRCNRDDYGELRRAAEAAVLNESDVLDDELE